MKFFMQAILENYDPARPLVLVPHGGTGLIDFTQMVYPVEDTVFLSSSRHLVEKFNEENPGVQFMTTFKFKNACKVKRFACVVVLGAMSMGRWQSQVHKSLRRARAAGTPLLCVTSDVGDPRHAYGLASALGVARDVFGSAREFQDRYLKTIDRPGFGQRWVAGVHKEKLVPLAEKVSSFTDARFVDGVPA